MKVKLLFFFLIQSTLFSPGFAQNYSTTERHYLSGKGPEDAVEWGLDENKSALLLGTGRFRRL